MNFVIYKNKLNVYYTFYVYFIMPPFDKFPVGAHYKHFIKQKYVT